MSEQCLKNVSVLVTRPVHQADEFCQLVESAGGKAYRFPVIEIQELSLEASSQDALQYETNALIFISANAVRLGIPLIKEIATERLSQGKVIAIGQATARQLEAMGVQPDVVPASPFNSEALLAMPEMQNIRGQHFLIIKGKGGRAYLMEQLAHRDATYSEIDIYERVKPKGDPSVLDTFMTTEKTVISVTSVKGLHYLFEMANQNQVGWLHDKPIYLVPGERVAEAVKDMHIKHPPVVAENATDPVMFDVLCQSLAIH